MTARSAARLKPPRHAAVGATVAGLADGIATPAHAEAVWFREYSAEKTRNGHKIALAVYRKRLGAPHPGEPARPVLFLVHGSSTSALTSFDLVVPGHREYSTMDMFAHYGFDVWTMDHEGYGKSARTDGNSDIASGVEDLRAAIPVVAHETGQSRCHFMGESSGALRAGAFAMAEPDHVGRLVLDGTDLYRQRLAHARPSAPSKLEYYKTHNRRPRDRAMIESIFTRDKPGTTDPAVAGRGGEAGTGSRRHGAHWHLSRHDRASAGDRSGEDNGTRGGDARRVRRHCDDGRSVGLLREASEWRQAVLGDRRRGACAEHVPSTAGVLACRTGVPDDAGQRMTRASPVARAEPLRAPHPHCCCMPSVAMA